jgi:hypothetical protein
MRVFFAIAALCEAASVIENIAAAIISFAASNG